MPSGLTLGAETLTRPTKQNRVRRSGSNSLPSRVWSRGVMPHLEPSMRRCASLNMMPELSYVGMKCAVRGIMSRFVRVITAAPLVAYALACSPSVVEPTLGPHPDSAFVPVTFPPPAARPETIPEPPSASAVWIDGEWRWRRNRWYWVLGRWEEPPPAASYFAATKLRYDDRGRLLYAAGTWRRDDGGTLGGAHAEKTADTTSGDVVEETGVLEDVGPNREAHRPRRRGDRPRPTCEVEKKCPFDAR
jgi:hypothetical protein